MSSMSLSLLIEMLVGDIVASGILLVVSLMFACWSYRWCVRDCVEYDGVAVILRRNSEAILTNVF